jgi:release factor glutamine methyltransferase
MSHSRTTAEGVAERLRAAGCVDAEAEADELMAVAPHPGELQAWIDRRARGEPLAWITGVTRFCGRAVAIDPGVYVPRVQTEELARRASELLSATAGRAADLCTGSGAVALHLLAEVPTANVVGVELDPRAARSARRNGVRTVLGDLDGSLRPVAFDVVTAVAPYVPTDEIRLLPADVQRYEPRTALDGGEDGLDVVRRVVAAAARLLLPGGWLVTEVGGEQNRALAPTLLAAGFEPATPWFDEGGDLRGLVARKLDRAP